MKSRFRNVTNKLVVYSWTEGALTIRNLSTLGIVVFPNKNPVASTPKP